MEPKEIRRSTRILSKKHDHSPEPLNIESLKTEELKRCADWIQLQKPPKKPRKSAIDRNSSTKFDKQPEASTDSLAILRHFRAADIRKSVLYVCEWENCLKEFGDENNLYSHVNSHIVDLQPCRKKFYCLWDLCKFDTECNKEITRHINYHSYHTVLKTIGEGISTKVNIPRCTNDSTNRNAVPELRSDFFCQWDECEKSFMSIHLFHVHVHGHIEFDDKFVPKPKRENGLYCLWEHCGKHFTVSYRLSEHVRKHINERVVGCFQCGALFKSNTIYFDHCKRQETNLGEEFQCADCLKCFASERLLRSHVLMHINSFQCAECEMTCNSAQALTKHVRYRHLLERPLKCPHCDRRFVMKNDLVKHVLSIHKKKTFPCAELGCKYAAKSLHRLKLHDREVHGDNSSVYGCHCCDKQYKRGRELSKHLKKVHQFQSLPGHTRFAYRMNQDGIYRLQTMRIESLEVSKHSKSTEALRIESEGTSFHVTELDPGTDLKVPFKVIATHDSTMDELDIPVKEEIIEEISAKDVIITFKELDEDGNVIQSKCISGNDFTIG